MRERILLVSQQGPSCEQIQNLLEQKGFEVTALHASEQAMKMLSSRHHGILLLDLDAREDGLELFRLARRIYPDISVIILTATGTISSAVAAVKEGVTDYLHKPCEPLALITAVEKTLNDKQILHEARLLPNGLVKKYSFSNIISKSPTMQYIFELIEKVSYTDSTVFITGETGVGKELVARAIHSNSPRKDMPFLPINCGCLTETLLESELFGHEKGAFTGAFKTKLGKFECAHKGTIFLDEVGDITPAMQVKLLRVLQERKIERVGGNDTIDVDVKVISATNQDIKEKINKHEFRIDLFYRLNVIQIHIPPLRDRIEDIPLLVHHFMNNLNKNLRRNVKGISSRAMKQLLVHSWPGNVRELENVLERAYITNDGDVIDQIIFPQYVQTPLPGESLENLDINIPFGLARSLVIKRFERNYLAEALKRYHGNVSEAAQETGINLRTLWRKMREHGLDRLSFRKKEENGT